jgi:hypothetical protein
MNKKICPKCGSDDVAYKPEAWQVKAQPTQNFSCNKCDYEGQMGEKYGE